MRIRGHGSSFGQNDQHQDSRRSERFRRSHRDGQKVRGKIVEWRSPGLAWVDIDGHRLLAQVDPDAQLGLDRLFLVVRLAPDILLKELPRASGGLDLLV